jgi:hypothetical protein
MTRLGGSLHDSVDELAALTAFRLPALSRTLCGYDPRGPEAMPPKVSIITPTTMDRRHSLPMLWECVRNQSVFKKLLLGAAQRTRRVSSEARNIKG